MDKTKVEVVDMPNDNWKQFLKMLTEVVNFWATVSDVLFRVFISIAVYVALNKPNVIVILLGIGYMLYPAIKIIKREGWFKA